MFFGALLGIGFWVYILFFTVFDGGLGGFWWVSDNPKR